MLTALSVMPLYFKRLKNYQKLTIVDFIPSLSKNYFLKKKKPSDTIGPNDPRLTDKKSH